MYSGSVAWQVSCLKPQALAARVVQHAVQRRSCLSTAESSDYLTALQVLLCEVLQCLYHLQER